MTSRSIQILTVLVLLTSGLFAQGSDARRKLLIAEAEKKLSSAKSELEAANEAIQDIYATLAATYRRAGAGQDPETQDDLERLVEPALEAAIKTAQERGNSRRIRSVFERKFGRSASLAETPFVKAVFPHLKASAAKYMESLGRDVTDLTVTAFVQELSSRSFSEETSFAEVWNTCAADRLPETKRYVTARATEKKVAQDLMILRDPKLRFTVDAPEGMARIPAQNVRIESKYGFDKKTRRAKVSNFFIDLKEVTHGEYWKNFYETLTDAKEKARHLPEDAEGAPLWYQEPSTGAFQPSPELLDLPVTGISALSAAAYAASQGKRLPTEAEWMAAAAGDPKKPLEYSYGDDFQPQLCNSKESGHAAALPVGQLADGRSHYGLYHVCGNVKEWTATTSAGRDLKPKKGFDDGDSAVIRGGSYLESQKNVSLKWRWVLPVQSRIIDVGFRCAKDVL